MKRRNKNRSILLRISAFIVIALLSVNLGILQVELAGKLSQSEQNEAIIEEKSNQVDELTNLLERSGDPEFIEDAARDRFGHVYPNEKVFYDIG